MEMKTSNSVVYTVGHSTHSLERFIGLLKMHSITALCDVRSQPYSRVNPQFNRELLKEQLWSNKIAYVFLGKEFGARSEDPSCYVNGKVQYERIAQSASFKRGLERLIEGLKKYQIALMCAEKDPLSCHRSILVSKHVANLGVNVHHILEDGKIETQDDALFRLVKKLHLPDQDIFRSTSEIISEAYRIQGERIAHEEIALKKSSQPEIKSDENLYHRLH
ncbi:MAG TPA: DUF488 domain-containing protein [Fibrobacteria bacterium]|nr:DUF488 domain-containing protein [Fibrobacteria bacterium]